MKRKLQDTSLDTFDDILNDGTLGEMSEKARMLVEDNPGKTVRELLQIGIDDEIYSRSDRNLIAPRITLLAEEGIIIRPRKRICTVSGRRVMVHELAPMAWKEQRAELYRTEESNRDCMIFKRQRANTSTKELVEALEAREGVESHYVEPHKNYDATVKEIMVTEKTGPATILIITD